MTEGGLFIVGTPLPSQHSLARVRDTFPHKGGSGNRFEY
jgi:hypothetical protein